MAVTVNASTSSGLVWSSDLTGAIQLQTNGTTVASTATNGDFAFNSGYGSAAVAYACRAWVNFNGTTATPSTIRGSGNVTSVTKGGTGSYTINFTSALVDANYAVGIGVGNTSATALGKLSDSVAPTTSAVAISTLNASFGGLDVSVVTVTVVR